MFSLMISESGSDMGHVGSKIRSLGPSSLKPHVSHVLLEATVLTQLHLL